MTPEAKQLVAFLASHPRPRGYPRLSFLTAALARDPELLHTPAETSRNEAIEAAAEAELHGDRARAAELYGKLVASPSFSWDYPERAALLRNLKDPKQIAAVCADTLRPAVFRPAWLVIRAHCRK
jgi:hypothetical protein